MPPPTASSLVFSLASDIILFVERVAIQTQVTVGQKINQHPSVPPERCHLEEVVLVIDAHSSLLALHLFLFLSADRACNHVSLSAVLIPQNRELRIEIPLAHVQNEEL